MILENQLHSCVNPIWLKKERMFVGCGKCEFCRKKWIGDWATRLMMQKQMSYLTICMTLTYNDDNLPYINNIPSLSKEDIQKFFKRVRKETNKLYPDVKYQYFITGEYGSSFLRPHYHLILFVNTDNNKITKYDIQTICLDKWKKGYIQFMESNGISIKYLAKYIGKTTGISDYAIENGVPLPFLLVSRNPAIASGYLTKNFGENFEYHFKSLEHCKIALSGLGDKIIPRYIRKKVYEHYPTMIKKNYYQQLNDQKQENYENKIRESTRRLRVYQDPVLFNNRFNPDVERYRTEERNRERARHEEMNNFLKRKQ